MSTLRLKNSPPSLSLSFIGTAPTTSSHVFNSSESPASRKSLDSRPKSLTSTLRPAHFPPPLRSSPPPEIAHLSETEQELLDCLWRAQGRWIETPVLVDLLYSNLHKEPPAKAGKTLHVFLHRLRKAVPYRIENRYNAYRLVMT